MTNPHGRWVPDPLTPSGYRWARHGEQPATTMLPTVQPSPRPREEPAEAGENDGLVERTFNGLRPDDLELEQPPQSPAWTPT